MQLAKVIYCMSLQQGVFAVHTMNLYCKNIVILSILSTLSMDFDKQIITTKYKEIDVLSIL